MIAPKRIFVYACAKLASVTIIAFCLAFLGTTSIAFLLAHPVIKSAAVMIELEIIFLIVFSLFI